MIEDGGMKIDWWMSQLMKTREWCRVLEMPTQLHTIHKTCMYMYVNICTINDHIMLTHILKYLCGTCRDRCGIYVNMYVCVYVCVS